MPVRLFCFLILALAFFGAQPRSHANDYTFSETEKVTFAFFHHANGSPDFETWIRNSPAFMSAAPERQETVFEQEMLRLKWGFDALDHERTDINLKTDILLQISNSGGTDYLNFKFIDSGKEEVPYFSYPYGNEWIAVIVNDLADYTTIPLAPSEVANLRPYIPDNKVYSGKVQLGIRPVSVDRNKPLKLDNTEQWLMMGRLSSIEFFTPSGRKDVSLWKHVDPTLFTESQKADIPYIQ